MSEGEIVGLNFGGAEIYCDGVIGVQFEGGCRSCVNDYEI